MNALSSLACKIMGDVNALGQYLSMLGLRLFLAWEFWESGWEKYKGDNWFADIQEKFPPPFNLLPTKLSWDLATWTELIASVLLVLGLGTRMSAFALLVIDIVAWLSVHAGNGYNVCDNGFKLPLIYSVMLLALILSGPGKLSLDALLTWRWCQRG